MKFVTRWLRRFADAAVSHENRRIAAKNAELQSQLSIRQLELNELLAVVARNLRRVEAEDATYARRKADSEGSSSVHTG